MTFATLLFMSACAGGGKYRIGVQGTSVDEIWKDLGQHWQEAKAFEAEMAVKGKIKGMRIRARPSVLLAYPDRFYLELGTAGAGPLVVIASADGQISMFFPRTREFLQEKATPSNMERLLGIPLSTRELVALLSGNGIPFDSYRLGAEGKSSGEMFLAFTASSPSLDRHASILVASPQSLCPEGGLKNRKSASSRLNDQHQATLRGCLRIVDGRIGGLDLNERMLNFSYSQFSTDPELPRRITANSKGLFNLRITLSRLQIRSDILDPLFFKIPIPRKAKRLTFSDFEGKGPVLLEGIR
ncbi:hypothetical protein ACFLU6_09700 [Acidobacteriota bacterium]